MSEAKDRLLGAINRVEKCASDMPPDDRRHVTLSMLNAIEEMASVMNETEIRDLVYSLDALLFRLTKKDG